MLYQDFDLLIDRVGENLRAQVLNSPAGQASAEFRLPFTEDKLEIYLLRLGRTHRATRRVESQEMNTAKTFGAALFDAVFSGDVKACFRSSIDEVRRQGAGLRIRLRLGNPSVADLPWEFLYNRSVNRFIALSVHTPLVRYMDLPERIQPIAIKPPIRVLVMISSPSDFPPLDVEAEWARLNESLADRVAAGQLSIERLANASLESLQHRLRRESYHIFHFIGHGEFSQELQEGVLVLESENKRGHKVDSQFLGMLLHDHESLRVAILNACEGARTSRTDPFAGSAQSLVQQGIPAVIAMQFEIADEVASRFAHEFYGALADGYPIDASLTEARKSIFAAGREVEWGTPVLYLRAPDGRIFDIDNSATPARRGPESPAVRESPSAADRDGLVDAIVAAAQSAFAGGQRVEAIEMLRRYDPSKKGIAEALRKLTLEHERLLAETHRAAREKLDEHLRAANGLLASGRVSEAWAHACDALQLDASDEQAIALEAKLRKALDDQRAREVARELAREQEEARRAEEARAREGERQRREQALRESERRAEAERRAEEGERERQRTSQPQALESRQPSSDATVSVLRSGQSSAFRRPKPVEFFNSRTRVLWLVAAAVIVVAGAALSLVPLTRSKQPPPASAAAPPIDATARAEPARTTPAPAAAPRAAPPASTPAAPAAAPEVSPPAAASRPEPTITPPDPRTDPSRPATGTASSTTPAGPPAATTGTAAPTPIPASSPNETIVVNFRTHVQALLAKKDPGRALSVLTEGLAYAPADKGLLAMGPKVLDQAKGKAATERSRALAQKASGRPKFREADRAVQRARTLSRDRKTMASAGAYLEAADLFASSAAGPARGRAARDEDEVPAAEAAAVAEPEPAPVAPAAKADPPPARPKPSGPVDPVIEAYVEAIARGDRAALLAVYPSAPADALAVLGKRPPGSTLRIIDTRIVRDSRGWSEAVVTVQSVTPSGAGEGSLPRLVVTLEPAGETWKVVTSRSR